MSVDFVSSFFYTAYAYIRLMPGTAYIFYQLLEDTEVCNVV